MVANPFPPTCYASDRLAGAMTHGLRMSRDFTSVEEWGRAIGVSAPTLRGWCRTARARPKRVLDFMRLLRAVVVLHDAAVDAFEILNIVEPRTLARMLRRGGIEGLFHGARRPSVEEFLRSQQYLPNPALLAAVLRGIDDAIAGDLNVTAPRTSA